MKYAKMKKNCSWLMFDKGWCVTGDKSWEILGTHSLNSQNFIHSLQLRKSLPIPKANLCIEHTFYLKIQVLMCLQIWKTGPLGGVSLGSFLLLLNLWLTLSRFSWLFLCIPGLPSCTRLALSPTQPFLLHDPFLLHINTCIHFVHKLAW